MEKNKKQIYDPQKAKEFRDAHKLNLKPNFFAKRESKTQPAEKIATPEIEER